MTYMMFSVSLRGRVTEGVVDRQCRRTLSAVTMGLGEGRDNALAMVIVRGHKRRDVGVSIVEEGDEIQCLRAESVGVLRDLALI